MPNRSLLDWLERPAPDRGIHFAGEVEAWDFRSYAQLAADAQRVAAALWGRVERNDVVAVVLRSGPDFVTALFGVMLAGAVPAPVAPPAVFGDQVRYREHLEAVLRQARPWLVLTEAEPSPLVAEAFGLARLVSMDRLLGAAADGSGPAVPGAPADLALVQFTSGSSGQARGVRVPHAALAANIAAIRGWLRMTRDDATASWLPVHHDMGLIGCLLTPVVNQSDIWLLRPEHFVRNPLRYIRCFGEAGAVLTAMPNFGLDHVVRRVRSTALEGLDLSRWRALIVGAERLDPDSFRRFEALLAPHGFRRRAFLPAYGLAEATLAATGLALDEEWDAASCDPASLALGRPVEAAREGGAGAAGASVMGCGRPVAGVEVEVVDDDGRRLDEGRVGEIVVWGRSVTAGYLETAGPASPTRLVDGALHTGDAGFVHRGQLYVIGRLGDALKIRGRALFAEDVEAALVEAGLSRRHLAVALGSRGGRATVVVALEAPRPGWRATAQAVAARYGEGGETVVLGLPRGAIVRTSSGKPKRRLLWQAFVDDRLATAATAPGP